jgi:hypothetical protein
LEFSEVDNEYTAIDNDEEALLANNNSSSGNDGKKAITIIGSYQYT